MAPCNAVATVPVVAAGAQGATVAVAVAVVASCRAAAVPVAAVGGRKERRPR